MSARNLGDWKVQLSDNGKTGTVDRVMLGLRSGQVVGISARFNAILGFGGKRVFIPWNLLTADEAHRVLKAHMTAAEMRAAPPN